MTLSEYIRSRGLPSVAYVSKMTGVLERTLYNWHKNRPVLFKIVVLGVQCRKRKGKGKDDDHRTAFKI